MKLHFLKLLTLIVALLLTVGCKKSIEGKMNVAQPEGAPDLVMKTSDGKLLKLPKGDMKVDLVVDGKHPEKSYLKLYLRKGNRKYRPEIPVRLPNINDLLGANDPVRLEGQNLGQNFGIMLVRQIRPGKDLFTMTLHDKEFDSMLGKMTFEYEPEKVLYDAKKGEFLASYQKVKRKQRAAVIRINGDVDRMLALPKKFGWLEQTLDHIVNYGGMVLVSPWAYVRYANVKWIIGDDNKSERNTDEKWKEVVKKYPVIDYFAFVHSGDQRVRTDGNGPRMTQHELGLKNNQLRLVYTGACSSGSGTEWIKDYSAVGAGGQRNTSASPIFQFQVLKKWAYGYDFETSVVKTWKSAVAKLRALEWITFAKYWEDKTGILYWKNVDDLLYDSEIMISYTNQVPAKNLRVSQSAILTSNLDEKDIIEKEVTEIIAERNGELRVE